MVNQATVNVMDAGALNYAITGNAVQSSVITTTATANTIPVISAPNIVVSLVDPRVNMQLNIGLAPDGSGKIMNQLEALVNPIGTGFGSVYLAQVALLNVAAYLGYLNQVFASNNSSTNVALMVW